jgi:hypothetical protein
MYTSKAHRIKSTWLSIMMNLDILSSAVNDGQKLLFELWQWVCFFLLPLIFVEYFLISLEMSAQKTKQS